jgi:hypothetical protein
MLSWRGRERPEQAVVRRGTAQAALSRKRRRCMGCESGKAQKRYGVGTVRAIQVPCTSPKNLGLCGNPPPSAGAYAGAPSARGSNSPHPVCFLPGCGTLTGSTRRCWQALDAQAPRTPPHPAFLADHALATFFHRCHRAAAVPAAPRLASPAPVSRHPYPPPVVAGRRLRAGVPGAAAGRAGAAHAQPVGHPQGQGRQAGADPERRRQGSGPVHPQQPPLGAAGADFAQCGQGADRHRRPPFLRTPRLDWRRTAASVIHTLSGTARAAPPSPSSWRATSTRKKSAATPRSTASSRKRSPPSRSRRSTPRTRSSRPI